MFLGFVIVDNKFLYFNVFIGILVFEIIVLKLELNLLYIQRQGIKKNCLCVMFMLCY